MKNSLAAHAHRRFPETALARNEWDRMGANVDSLELKFGGDRVGQPRSVRLLA